MLLHGILKQILSKKYLHTCFLTSLGIKMSQITVGLHGAFLSLILVTCNETGRELNSFFEQVFTLFLTVSHITENAAFHAALLCLNKPLSPLLYFAFERDITALPIGVLTDTAICPSKNFFLPTLSL